MKRWRCPLIVLGGLLYAVTAEAQGQLNFSLSTPANVTVVRGSSGSTTITANELGNSTTPVFFVSASPLPSGVNASFSPTNCDPTCSTTLTLATTSSTPTGTFQITVTASRGSGDATFVRTTQFNLTVTAASTFNYSLSNSGGITVARGQSGSTTITATLVTGPSQTVSYSVDGPDAILNNVTASFNTGPCSPTCSRILTLNTSPATPLGDFVIGVTGSPLDRTTGFTLRVTEGSDVTPPDTSITGGPSGATTTTAATFTWTGTDNVTPVANLVYAFRLDPLETSFSAFGPATSRTYTGLANGSYTFFVKARDQAGNEDSSPATRSFAVNAAPAGVGTVTTVSGPAQITIQGQTAAIGPGTGVPRGATVQTGGGGQVGGNCSDGTQFALSANTTVFLDDALCQASASGMVDVLQGQFALAPGTTAATSGSPHTAAVTFGSGVRTPVSQAAAVTPNANFSTTYNVAGQTGTSRTTVTSGSVQVVDSTTGAVTNVVAPGSKDTSGPIPNMVASILPSSRSVRVGDVATAAATMINTDPNKSAIACGIAPITNVPATFSFQTIGAPPNNQVTGSKSTPVAIPPGGRQDFVFALQPNAPVVPEVIVQFSFACGGPTQAPVIAGVDTLLFTSSTTPVPDVVAVAGTQGNTGIVEIPGATGTGAFVVATTNLGASATITVSGDAGGAQLPVVITICQTNAATGQCLAPASPTVTLPIGAGAQPTFAIFVRGTGPIAFDPATRRIFVRFKDPAGVTRGATSVAVRTQ